MAENKRKTELIAELARSRSRIAGHVVALRSDLNFAARAKRAVLKNPVLWMAAASLIGLLLSKVPAGRKKIAIGRSGKEKAAANAGKAGLLLGALKIAFDLSRPFLFKLAKQRVTASLARRKAGRYAPP